MTACNRREFLMASALAGAPAPAAPRIGLVRSTHARLPRPASLDDPLDYERVRDMVWQAIAYGAPRAGSLEAKIRSGAWVVVKPNMGLLRPQPGYRAGDITDLRVTRAVVEYLARRSPARRITIAEGGSYRNLHDTTADNAVMQDGQRCDLPRFDWGPEEFPGAAGSVGGLIQEMQGRFPEKTFDYVDLSYDAVRDGAGRFRRIEVPKTARGVGAFGARPDYYVTNTIRNCDFLISVPVMKVHLQCGITACFKNYVGTAPREAWQIPGMFNNIRMHHEHSADNRIDPFIIDMAAFHPPDYCVVDAIRGLQFQEHNNWRADQMLRSNMVLAGEDPVAVDALAARLMGFNVWDMDFLHLAQAREMGSMDLTRVDLRGDDPVTARRSWGPPEGWHGRANREWRIGTAPDTALESWQAHHSPTDTVRLERLTGGKLAPGARRGLAVRVHADGHRKAHLWMGVRGRASAWLNGEKVAEAENRTRYRVGQFRYPVALRPGENLLRFQLEAVLPEMPFSALLVGPGNDGHTVEGIRYLL
jgi:uncharacterized protein (DUF362 family)